MISPSNLQRSGLRAFASSKSIVSGQKARQTILRGCDKLADTVGTTLGPRGRNVIIEQTYGPPKITKDGVTVARAIELSDKLENMGASLIKQVAQAANEASGDGTTTATVLAREIFRGGCEAVGAGLRPMEVLKGIRCASEAVRKFLTENSRQIVSSEDIYHVAKVSANGDERIGRLIADAMERVGRDGTITVSEGKSLEHELQFVEGYQFDRGFVSAYLATNARTQKCEMQMPYVLLVDEKISSVESLVPILEQIMHANSEVLIIAEDIEGDALATLVVNKLRGGLKICAVRAPGFGDYRKKQLEDLAVLTGGCVVSKETGITLENIKLQDLGRIKRAVIGKDETLLLEGQSDPLKLKERIEGIKFQMKEADVSEYEKTKLQERYGKLAGGVAVIQVGGGSEVEVGEAKDRLDDALCATRAAIESGVLPGGGSALLFAGDSIKNLKGDNIDQDSGIRIIRNACGIPVRLIASNAGFEGAIVAGTILREHKLGSGFDANTGVYVDMVKSGILDPTKVVTTALLDAASVASMMCTTEAAILTAPAEGQGDSSRVPKGLDDF